MAAAEATVPFQVKYTTNANGAMVTIGNNLLTCPDGSVSTTVGQVSCADARAGASVNNNSYTMGYLDTDNDPATFNSSAAQLSLPTGATVLWAGLYWGARLTAGTGGTSVPTNTTTINSMSFKAPGDASYRTINASTAAHDQFGPNTASYGAYQRYADVTSIVQSGGSGNYWGADVVAGTGQDRYAGWAVTVVYTAPSLPLRNLTVFDGFALVQNGSPQVINLSGFQAPLSGTVDSSVTMVAYEGDLGQGGDFASLNSTQLATAVSPGTNFFDSTDDDNGASVAARTPADQNMLGYDIKNLGTSGAIQTGDTSAQFTFSCTGDTYYPGVLGLAINLYAPDFVASSKGVVDVTGNSPAQSGDTLAYTLNYVNTGQDDAIGAVASDTLPPNTTYVPGSLAWVDFVTGETTPLTDAPGDDAGEYIAASRTIQVQLGNMACSGSDCQPDESTQQAFKFEVTLGPGSAGTTVTNTALLDYKTATTQIAGQYTTDPADTPVLSLTGILPTRPVSPTGPSLPIQPIVPGGTATGGPDTGGTDSGGTGSGGTGGTGGTGSGGTAVGRGPIADLGVSSTASTLTPIAGQDITFSGYAVQNGPDEAINVTGDTTFPVGFVPVSFDVPFNDCSWSPAKPADPYHQPWQNIAYSLHCQPQMAVQGWEAGGAVTNIVVMHIPTDTPVGVYEGQSTITSQTADDFLDNNLTTMRLVVQQAADTVVTKSLVTPLIAGQTATWRLTATDKGPFDAAEVDLVDQLPAGTTFVSAQVDGGPACQAPQLEDTQMVLHCPLARLGIGDSNAVSVLVVLKINTDQAGQQLCNTSLIGSDMFDPNDADNESMTCDMVASPSGLVTAPTGGAAVPVGRGVALALLVMVAGLLAYRRVVTHPARA